VPVNKFDSKFLLICVIYLFITSRALSGATPTATPTNCLPSNGCYSGYRADATRRISVIRLITSLLYGSLKSCYTLRCTLVNWV